MAFLNWYRHAPNAGHYFSLPTCTRISTSLSRKMDLQITCPELPYLNYLMLRILPSPVRSSCWSMKKVWIRYHLHLSWGWPETLPCAPSGTDYWSRLSNVGQPSVNPETAAHCAAVAGVAGGPSWMIMLKKLAATLRAAKRLGLYH